MDGFTKEKFLKMARKKKRVDTNIIYCGDCKDILKKIPDESIDLIYLDPPFFSQKHYEEIWVHGQGDHETRMGFSDREWEKIKENIDPNVLREYKHIEERWKGGHRGLYVYIAYMRERLEQCERVLKKTGSIYLHCDWHAGHYLKMMMDEVFGYNNFRSEIIWKRTFHPKGSQFKDKKFGVYTDSIFLYTKSDKYTFELERIRIPLTKEELKEKYPEQDNRGRYLVYPIIRSASKGERPNLVYEYKGYTPEKWGWVVNKEKLKEIDKRGDLSWNTKGTPFRKYRSWEDRGKPIGNLWDDIPRVGSGENLGYPTQKPEKLMERILEVSSNYTDIVLDPFCGCGTTLAVAKRMGRQFIGIDISRVACDVMKKRLGGIKVIGGETKEELAKMDGHTFARLVIVEKMGGIVSPRKSGDMGIDGWVDFKTAPVQVKNWGHKVGRPEIDKFKTAIERDHKNSGIMVANDFSKDCYEEVARIEKDAKIKIELRKVDEIFK